MKLFLTFSLLLLLVALALSKPRWPVKKIKFIYDEGYYRYESREAGIFKFHTENPTEELIFEAGKWLTHPAIYLELVPSFEKPSLEHLSFVVESVPWMRQCDLAPAFKSLVENCTGPIRVRELTDEERSKTHQRKEQLVASLETKKRELKGITTPESGEFRLLVDNVSKDKVLDSIGFRNFQITKDDGVYFTRISAQNTIEDPVYYTNKLISVRDIQGSFAFENILGANERKNCTQSPLKDEIYYCEQIEVRPLTTEERSELDEFKGSI